MDHDEKEIEANKVPKAPILFSTRLTLALICLFATWNFMFQRLTINFGLVCMVQLPLNGTLLLFDDFQNSSEVFSEELTPENSTIIEEDLEVLTESPVLTSCPIHIPKNATGRLYDGDFTWSKETQGLILASFYWGYTFSQIPGGWAADRFGSKLSLIWSGVFLSLSTILITPASFMGPEYLVVVRFLGGAANGASMPAINSLCSRWFPDIERSLMLGIAYAGFGSATAMAYPISAFFCEFTGWAYLFYFAGAVGLFWCVLTYFLVFEWPEVHPRISQKELTFVQKHRAVAYGGKREKIQPPWLKMLSSGPIWALFIANFCCFWLFLVMGMYLPTYLKEVLHLDISENGLLSSVPFIMMMIVHFIIGVAFDNLRKRKCCSVTALRKIFNTFGALIAPICIAGIAIVSCDGVGTAIALVTLSQVLLEFCFMGGYIFSLFELAPRYASSITAMMNTFGLAVGLLAPPLVSYLTPQGAREEWLNVFYISAGICAFGGVFYLVFGSSELQSWAKVDKLEVKGGSSGKDKELKVLHIRLLNGESNVNGEIVPS